MLESPVARVAAEAVCVVVFVLVMYAVFRHRGPPNLRGSYWIVSDEARGRARLLRDHRDPHEP